MKEHSLEPFAINSECTCVHSPVNLVNSEHKSDVCELGVLPWSHKPVSLNGHLGNSEIGGCKEIRQPFVNPSPTCANP